MKSKPLIHALLLLPFLSACTTNDPHQRAKTGAAIGAVVGAVAGHQMNDRSGKFVGAAVGALAGAAIGNYMDDQQREFEESLAVEQERHDVEIERLKDDTLKLSVNNEVSFAFDSADISPAFKPTLCKLARLLNKYNKTVVHIIGHTDNRGANEYNETLSSRRADHVAFYLEDRGVPGARIRTEGRGESEPRATNTTEAGRQLNRRVEIYVKPIVEGDEETAYESPRY
ncbi:MAG: OmpA family protein [Chromatiales bacterium]